MLKSSKLLSRQACFYRTEICFKLEYFHGQKYFCKTLFVRPYSQKMSKHFSYKKRIFGEQSDPCTEWCQILHRLKGQNSGNRYEFVTIFIKPVHLLSSQSFVMARIGKNYFQHLLTTISISMFVFFKFLVFLFVHLKIQN